MRRAVLLLALFVAACGAETAAPEPAAQPMLAQVITYPDIEANDLYGASCNYASGKSMGAVVVAENDGAAMKFDRQIKRFDLDPQCDKLPMGSGSRYLAPGYVLDLSVDGEAKQTGYETVDFEKGTVTLSDEEGNILYSTSGHVQCGA